MPLGRPKPCMVPLHKTRPHFQKPSPLLRSSEVCELREGPVPEQWAGLMLRHHLLSIFLRAGLTARTLTDLTRLMPTTTREVSTNALILQTSKWAQSLTQAHTISSDPLLLPTAVISPQLSKSLGSPEYVWVVPQKGKESWNSISELMWTSRILATELKNILDQMLISLLEKGVKDLFTPRQK